MKLRIEGNSIRLRLTQPELSRFGATGRVEETLRFADGRRLVYALHASQEVEGLTALFEGNVVTLSMPAAWAQTWVEPDRVGFEGVQPLGEGEKLHLLVEKDFQCLHKRPDEEDAFPHPLANELETPQ